MEHGRVVDLVQITIRARYPARYQNIIGIAIIMNLKIIFRDTAERCNSKSIRGGQSFPRLIKTNSAIRSCYLQKMALPLSHSTTQLIKKTIYMAFEIGHLADVNIPILVTYFQHNLIYCLM